MRGQKAIKKSFILLLGSQQRMMVPRPQNTNTRLDTQQSVDIYVYTGKKCFCINFSYTDIFVQTHDLKICWILKPRATGLLVTSLFSILDYICCQPQAWSLWGGWWSVTMSSRSKYGENVKRISVKFSNQTQNTTDMTRTIQHKENRTLADFWK